MNKSSLIACLGLALMVSPLVAKVTAQSTSAPTIKIGVIDLERTLSETPAGKRANEKFEKTRKAKQGELDKKQKGLQQAAIDLEKQAPMLKPEVLKSKKDELEKQFVEIQQTYMKLEKDLAGERAKLIQDLLKQASPIVQDIAKAEGVNMIVDQAAVVWAAPGIDLTDKLNARMK